MTFAVSPLSKASRERAISLRVFARSSSGTTAASSSFVDAGGGSAHRLAGADEFDDLPALSPAARLEATLTTRARGGSGHRRVVALTIAACGALASGRTNRPARGSAADRHERRMPDDQVPTGVQDYRPALYGGVVAIS